MRDQDKTKEQLIRELVTVRQRLNGIARKSEIEHRGWRQALKQQACAIELRIRELNCVLAFSNIIQNPDRPMNEIAEGLVEIIPTGWKNPDLTCARVTLKEQSFQSVNFAESIWKLSTDISFGEEKIGTIEVFYLGSTDSNPFLLEEQYLLNDLTNRFGRIFRRQLAEETLREKEAYYREVFVKSNYGMAVTDLDGRFLDCNRAFLDLLGYASCDELQALTYSDITPPEYREDEKRLIVEQTGEEGYSEVYEKEFIHKGGDRVPVMIKLWLRRDLNRRPVGMYIIVRDMIKRKIAQESLRKRELELVEKTTHLEEVNTALKVLLKHREGDKAELEERILANVKKIIIPYLEKLKKSSMGPRDSACLQIIETNLNNLISPFLTRLSAEYAHLSSREIQVAHLVKEGKTTKEIAEMLGVSTKAIDLYRGGIRRKLGLKRKSTNLRSHLTSLL